MKTLINTFLNKQTWGGGNFASLQLIGCLPMVALNRHMLIVVIVDTTSFSIFHQKCIYIGTTVTNRYYIIYSRFFDRLDADVIRDGIIAMEDRVTKCKRITISFT